MNHFKKHGLYGTPPYRVWNSIIGRCENPKDPGYKNYGGRGISIYPTWRKDFKSFYDYVSLLPNFNKKGFVVDRIDNNGNYEPGNIRWVTYHLSNLNKRKPKHNTSGLIGVSFSKKDNAFVSYITINKKRISIKQSKDPVIVAQARDSYIKEHNLTDYTLNYE